MNISSLYNIKNTIGHSGTILSTEEIVILENSLLILQQENHFRNVFFWGKLYGINKDYYIAFGYMNDVLQGLVYFYSTTGHLWNLLPKSTPKTRLLASLSVNKLYGDPSQITDVFEQYANTKPFGTEIFMVQGRKIKDLKEEDRVAAIIDNCNEDALITPRGALYKRPDGCVVENLTYEGLHLPEACELASYMHWRQPRYKWNTNLLVRSDYNYGLDFLDTIDRDIPKNCWVLHTINGGTMSLLRSLYWPGATFYQIIDKRDHGWFYLGSGKRDLDIPHMLHKWD